MEEMPSPSPSSEVDMKQVEAITVESDKENGVVAIQGLDESRNELLTRVQNLKKPETLVLIEQHAHNFEHVIIFVSEPTFGELIKSVRNGAEIFREVPEGVHLSLLGRTPDLQEWRGRLDLQVKNYRQELGDVRTTLNTEVEQLRTEFQDLRDTLKQQLEATSFVASEQPSAEKSTSMQPEFESPNHSQESPLSLA